LPVACGERPRNAFCRVYKKGPIAASLIIFVGVIISIADGEGLG